jgi:hypothetical protein
MIDTNANPAGSGNGDSGARQENLFGQNKSATNSLAILRDARGRRAMIYMARAYASVSFLHSAAECLRAELGWCQHRRRTP